MLFMIATIILFTLSLFKINSKGIAVLQLLYIWILMGWNTGGMDYVGNKVIYYTSNINNIQGISGNWLSNLIGYYFQYQGMDFIAYNVFTTLVVLIIFGIVIIRESKRPCMVINLFLVYPFLDSVVQKRFFLGMILTLMGMFFLVNNKKLLYLLSIILAVGFHFSFVIYFPFLLIGYIDKKREKFFLMVCIVAELIVLRWGNLFLQNFFSVGKLERYIFETSYSSYIIGVAYAFSLMIYIFISERMTKEFQLNENVVFFRKLNRLSVVFIPLCLFESVYLRYYRIVLLFAYILVSNEVDNSLIKNKKIVVNKANVWIWIFILYTVVMNLILYCTSANGLSGYINTVLDNKFI